MKKITLKRLKSTGDITMYPKIQAGDILKEDGGSAVPLMDNDFLKWTLAAEKRFLIANTGGYYAMNAAATRSAFQISIADHAATEHADYLGSITPVTYAGGVTYHQGDFVFYNSYCYRCKADNTVNEAPNGGPTSNVYWEYIGSDTVSLEWLLNNRIASVDGNNKVDISLFETVIDTTASMRFKGSVALSADSATPTVLSDIANDIDFTSEDTVKEYMNYFWIVTTAGYIKDVTSLTANIYSWEGDVTAEDEGDSSPEQYLELGDIIVIQTYTKDAPDVGLYSFGFGIINHTELNASETTPGLATLASLITDRRSTLSGTKVVNEGGLRNVLRDIRPRLVINGLPAGAQLKQANEVFENFQDGTSSDDISLLGAGVTKAVYQWNGAAWQDIGDLTFADAAFDRNYAYQIGSDYFRAFDNGTNTYFAPEDGPLEDDLVLEMVPISLVI